MKFLRLLLLFIFTSSTVRFTFACDLCGYYTPQMNAMSATEFSRWYAAVAEQFTHFGTLQFDGDKIDNPTGQYFDSSITQLVAGYNINPRFALQLSVPLIYREFKRPEGFAIDRGSVGGLGGRFAFAQTVAFHYASPARRTFEVSGKNPVAIEQEPDFTASALLLIGIKFPTGDSSRCRKNFTRSKLRGHRRAAFMATI